MKVKEKTRKVLSFIVQEKDKRLRRHYAGIFILAYPCGIVKEKVLKLSKKSLTSRFIMLS